jgi:hypothetical protein
MYASRTAITGSTGSSTSTVASPSFELGETAVLISEPRAWASDDVHGSVWYSYTARAAGIVAFTAASSRADVLANRMHIALYRASGSGGGFNGLQLVGRSFEFEDSWGPVYGDTATVVVAASDVIVVQVMSDIGPIKLTWSLRGTMWPPPVLFRRCLTQCDSTSVATVAAAASNDNFAARSTLRGTSGRLTGNFYQATLEAGEPLPHLFGSKSSLWFKFAPTTSTTLALEHTEDDSGVSYIATVFLERAASPSLSTLVEVPSSAVTGTGDSYALQGGRTYAIQIRDVLFERGPFTVLWRLVGACAVMCPLGCLGVRGLPPSALVTAVTLLVLWL